MPTLKEYNIKLTRLRSTHKMTKTMKMVAANKLRKAQEAHRKAADYADRIHAIASRLALDKDLGENPFLMPRPAGRALVVLVTSERGLCGGFNNNLNRKVAKWISDRAGQVSRIELSCCGKKGFVYFKNKARGCRHYEGVTLKPGFADAMRIGADVRKAFLDGEADEVWLAYNVSGSAMSHTPTIEQLLPVERPTAAAETVGFETWIVEPKGPAFADALIPRYVNMKIFFALLSNSMGEHGARMAAMDSATRNAESLIDMNTLLRNRARQTKITTELIEVVAGAEALK
jgi:F-type H+-transporting ATPase subunit gamma